jgi:hypothetical protein
MADILAYNAVIARAYAKYDMPSAAYESHEQWAAFCDAWRACREAWTPLLRRICRMTARRFGLKQAWRDEGNFLTMTGRLRASSGIPDCVRAFVDEMAERVHSVGRITTKQMGAMRDVFEHFTPWPVRAE